MTKFIRYDLYLLYADMVITMVIYMVQVGEAGEQMKKFEARVSKLRQTPGLDADPDVSAPVMMLMIISLMLLMLLMLIIMMLLM